MLKIWHNYLFKIIFALYESDFLLCLNMNKSEVCNLLNMTNYLENHLPRQLVILLEYFILNLLPDKQYKIGLQNLFFVTYTS